jgi:molecular chaperone DnaK (HSP70)
MVAASFRGGRRETARRPDPPRRPAAPLRAPDPNVRRLGAIVRRPTLAIDLGTYGSSAMLVTSERDISVEDPHAGHAIWPSVVAYDGVGPRVGGAGNSLGRVHPDRYQPRLKQLLGETAPITLGGTAFRPVELVGLLFAGIRAEAERAGGVQVTRAALTVPVGFLAGDPRRNALIQAAELAGFTAVELVSEPIATVAAPIVGGVLGPGDIAMVCDLGASGFTASLVSLLKGGTVELLSYREHPECSGLEIDRMIMSELMTRAGRSWNDLLKPPDDPALRLRSLRAHRALEDKARGLKHQLSTHESATELIGPDDVAVEMTADELTTLVAPLLYRAMDTFRATLTDSGVRPGELAAVLITGGGSRMPAVPDVLAQTFHRPIRTSVDPSRAPVEGAARFARAAEQRNIRARVATERETPLRWDIPGGHADQLHWLVALGLRFGATDPIAVVRLDDGALWELRSGRAGTLIRTHAPEGATIATGDWLATVELDVRPFR